MDQVSCVTTTTLPGHHLPAGKKAPPRARARADERITKKQPNRR